MIFSAMDVPYEVICLPFDTAMVKWVAVPLWHPSFLWQKACCLREATRQCQAPGSAKQEEVTTLANRPDLPADTFRPSAGSERAQLFTSEVKLVLLHAVHVLRASARQETELQIAVPLGVHTTHTEVGIGPEES